MPRKILYFLLLDLLNIDKLYYENQIYPIWLDLRPTSTVLIFQQTKESRYSK